MLILLQSFRIIELEWACSSAGRAPALQLSRLNYISAASGVAYTQTYGAIIALNWTEGGRNMEFTNGQELRRLQIEVLQRS